MCGGQLLRRLAHFGERVTLRKQPPQVTMWPDASGTQAPATKVVTSSGRSLSLSHEKQTSPVLHSLTYSTEAVDSADSQMWLGV